MNDKYVLTSIFCLVVYVVDDALVIVYQIMSPDNKFLVILCIKKKKKFFNKSLT